MSQLRSLWKSLAAVAVASVLLLVVVDAATSEPPTVPRAPDVARSARDLPVAGEERVAISNGASVVGNGVVEPRDREIKVAGSLPGRIARVLVHEGDVVKAGAVLVELESDTERAALDAAEGELLVAKAELARTEKGLRSEDVEAVAAEAESARARAELSASTLERMEKLTKSGAATVDEIDRARRQAAIDKKAADAAFARRKAAESGSRIEDITVAKARVAAAAGRRDQARAALARLSVRAPIEGEILAIKLRGGEYYVPGGAEPLLVMGDTSALRVRMDVDERDVAAIQRGAIAEVTSSAQPGRKFSGRVLEIARRMGRKNVRTDDPTERIDTKILEVLIELDGAPELFPGQRVLATLIR
jgi:HlyD family secretion protein